MDRERAAATEAALDGGGGGGVGAPLRPFVPDVGPEPAVVNADDADAASGNGDGDGVNLAGRIDLFAASSNSTAPVVIKSAARPTQSIASAANFALPKGGVFTTAAATLLASRAAASRTADLERALREAFDDGEGSTSDSDQGGSTSTADVSDSEDGDNTTDVAPNNDDDAAEQNSSNSAVQHASADKVGAATDAAPLELPGGTPDAVVAAKPLSAAQQNSSSVGGNDPLAPLTAILNRDELMEFLSATFGGLPALVDSGADEASRRRRAELKASRRAAVAAARLEELRRRAAMAERLVDAGLGAHVRFGDAADAAALDADALAELQKAGVVGLKAVAAMGLAAAATGDRDVDGEIGTEDDEDDDGPAPLVVGMVGYPNVGKSSTINALLGATAANHGAARVGVGATPGKTKHFQTLRLSDTITLCDCPGLVMPSFVSTREEMVRAAATNGNCRPILDVVF